MKREKAGSSELGMTIKSEDAKKEDEGWQPKGCRYISRI
jgi:hypothetical protein